MIRSIHELVAPEDVGTTLPHEHILHTIGSIASSSGSRGNLEIRYQDLIEYRRAPFAHGGRNLLLQKEDEAFRELERLEQLNDKKSKVLIVDVTLPSEGRDVLIPERLHLVKRFQDVIFVTVTTFELNQMNEKFLYRGVSIQETSERIARRLEAELLFGMEKGGVVVFPGAIYQQIHANSQVLGPEEMILVQGLALAQARTHCPLYLSISYNESCGMLHGTSSSLDQVVRAWICALLDAGAEGKKIVVCHVNRWCHGRFEEAGYAFLLELLDLSVTVLFDMIGLLAVSEVLLINPSFTQTGLSSDKLLVKDNQEPISDSRIVEWIVKLLEHKPEYLFQILLSTNIHQRVQYRCYGGEATRISWYVPPEAPPIPKKYLQCSICSNYFEPVEGEYFTKFAFTYCGTKCLRRHSRQKFAPTLAKS
ncbi:unnamed protein product [Peronospora belbahrii]|uniref:Vms1-associating treble clef domain-containing protein n=1 Tax=Peronospora belbahrii TaxID=622444 RepID=A0AAU9L2A3_9STRA|nr:unnamed protein product [Peronospora belbahrii]